MDINETVRAAKEGSKSAKESLCRKYQRLVHKLAWKYPYLDHDDLVQEGFIGILEAIETYDPDRGASFFTWVYWKIRGKNTQLSRTHKSTYSLDYQYEGATLIDLLEDESSPYEAKQDYSHLMDAVRVVRECTSTERSFKMVADRVGLFGVEPLNNGSVAVKYGISKQSASNCMKRFKKQAQKKFPELKELL